MLESISFKNFRVLRNATLPLGPFTLIVGPNGSGKSTALLPFVSFLRGDSVPYARLVSVAAPTSEPVEVKFQFSPEFGSIGCAWRATPSGAFHIGNFEWRDPTDRGTGVEPPGNLLDLVQRARVYSLDPRLLPDAVQLQPKQKLMDDRPSLAGVLDRLRDLAPERFEALNAELGRLLPEFDRILFDTPEQGKRSFLLRTRSGHHAIPAAALSQGTLFALTILTLAYLPDPPPLIALEEPDRGIHPRLLRELRDALYRLSYPENFGETRPPVQVIATTQSPYFLDLFSERPEEIVIADKVGLEATFSRLVDRPDIAEILDGTDALGQVWFSGVLGGVPASP